MAVVPALQVDARRPGCPLDAGPAPDITTSAERYLPQRLLARAVRPQAIVARRPVSPARRVGVVGHAAARPRVHVGRQAGLAARLDGQVIVDPQRRQDGQGRVVHPAVAEAKRTAGSPESSVIGVEGQLQAMVDPGLIAVVDKPAAALGPPPPGVNMQAQFVARAVESRKGLLVALDDPRCAAVGLFDLRVHAKEPGNAHRRAGVLREPRPQRVHAFERRLETLPVHRSKRVRLALVGLDVDAQDDRDGSHWRACYGFCEAQGTAQPGGARTENTGGSTPAGLQCGSTGVMPGAAGSPAERAASARAPARRTARSRLRMWSSATAAPSAAPASASSATCWRIASVE